MRGSRAARWFGIGVVAAPVVDVADDTGILSGVLRLDLDILSGIAATSWLQLAFFVAVGVAAAAVFARHERRGRLILYVGCCVPLAAYLVVGGLRLSSVIALVALAFAYVAWRLDDP